MDLVMVGAEVLGDQVGVGELVAGLAARGLEPDAERGQPRCPASASSATTRLESMPPESSTPTGTSATMRRSHRDAQRVEHGALPVALASSPRGSRRGTPAPVDGPRGAAVRMDDAHGRGRQLPHAGQDGPRSRHDRVEAHVVVQRHRIDRGVHVAGGEQCRQRRGEPQPARRLERYSGLMPSRSRPSTSRPLSRSSTAKANMPRKWSTQRVPHRWYALSSTSLSESRRTGSRRRRARGAARGSCRCSR